MAIRKNTRRIVELILRLDDAIDWEPHGEGDSATDGEKRWDRYVAGGFDERELRFKDGATPTRFRLERMSDAAKQHAEELLEGTALDPVALRIGPRARRFILRATLRAVTGFEVEQDGGAVTQVRQPELEDDRQLGVLVKPGWFAEADLPRPVEFGLAVFGWQLSESQIPFCGSSNTRSGG